MSAHKNSNPVRRAEQNAAAFAGTRSVQRADRRATADEVGRADIAIEPGQNGGVDVTVARVGGE